MNDNNYKNIKQEEKKLLTEENDTVAERESLDSKDVLLNKHKVHSMGANTWRIYPTSQKDV